MRLIALCLLLTTLHLTSFGQKINYKIPEGYEDAISKEDYKKIVDVVLPLVSKRFKIESLKAGTIKLKEGENLSEMNLDNLIGKCIMAKDKTQWDAIIKEHCEKIISSIDEQKEIDPKHFESVKKYLSVRIYPKESLANADVFPLLVVKTDLEGTSTVLMLDLPSAFTTVKKEDFLVWKKDSSEVFMLAQQNINKQEIEKETAKIDIDGTKVEMTLLYNENYAASYALDLGNNEPDLVGEWGSVVAIPNKGLVAVCQISKAKPVDFVKFIQGSKQVIESYYNEHPQRVSDQFYWYYKGTFTKISVQLDAKGTLNVMAPMGLVALMTEQK